MQIFGDTLEWPSPKRDQIVADMIRNRGLN
jgi:hypothetical protein